MSSELDKIIEESDNPFEALLAALVHMIIQMIFSIMDVILEVDEES